jgi:hypothetical protein
MTEAERTAFAIRSPLTSSAYSNREHTQSGMDPDNHMPSEDPQDKESYGANYGGSNGVEINMNIHSGMVSGFERLAYGEWRLIAGSITLVAHYSNSKRTDHWSYFSI